MASSSANVKDVVDDDVNTCITTTAATTAAATTAAATTAAATRHSLVLDLEDTYEIKIISASIPENGLFVLDCTVQSAD